jgi:hypothetical protein
VFWKTDEASLVLEVSVPPNMIATVLIPGAAPGTVTEAGLPVASAPGVKVLGRRRAGLAVSIGSGDYAFIAQPRIVPPSKG